ncbi:MAG TPA: tetratricopeptide repeat protein [Gemmatimonadales bacterium]|nr:tetratricopeptide repeat protein [Gemmatimonadales bacterium]
MSLEKLKDTARKFEQKEDWRKAIEAYLKAIQQMESGKGDAAPDLSLYNRVGDLYLKVNDTQAAVRAYERAVDLYADQGFFNNAIALCGKILRVNPGRTHTYLKLAQLHARKNVVIEAKRNLLEFLERMNAQGQLDEAFASVKEFADQFSGSQEIRLMLVELLRASQRAEEAHEQLERLCADLEAKGDAVAARRTRERLEPALDGTAGGASGAGDLIFLDTGFGAAASAPAGPAMPEPEPLASLIEPASAATDDLLRTDGLMGAEALVIEPSPSESVGGFQSTLLDAPPDQGAEVVPLVAGLELDPGEGGAAAPPLDVTLERTETIEFQTTPLEGLETGDVGFERVAEDTAGFSSIVSDPGLDLSEELAASLTEPAPAARGPAELTIEHLDLIEPSPSELALIEVVSEPAAPPSPAAAGPVGLGVLEQAVADRPEDAATHRALADELVRLGETERAIEELEIAAQAYELQEAWDVAGEVTALVITLAPDEIRHYQKLVEFAYRTGDKARLIDAYLALADVLHRLGESDKAEAVYQRVVDHEPANATARAALEALKAGRRASGPPGGGEQAASPLAGQPRGDFVDLGSLVIDEGVTRDTRIRVRGTQPTDDEQRNFEETLAAFKRGIEENIDLDDYQSHYDLGVAFKEMGLLDEAIAEFQKALRAPEGRLRTSEALGTAFYDKGQFAIAETVLRRAVDTLGGGDDDKIGLLYWLGRAREAQGRLAEALGAYERALAVDIRFMDLGERMQRLGAGRQ